MYDVLILSALHRSTGTLSFLARLSAAKDLTCACILPIRNRWSLAFGCALLVVIHRQGLISVCYFGDN